MILFKNVMVPMRDGVRLATDVYLPPCAWDHSAEHFPALLGRTSYGKVDMGWIDPSYYVPRGYAVVLQDLRGRGDSEGTGQYFHSANPTEGPDGYDTIEWIASQPWSNGKVGMGGSSHGGMVQTVAALHRPPHLSTIWADVGPTNVYAHTAREGGAMSYQTFSNLFLHAHDAQEIRDDPVRKAVLFNGMENLWEWIRSAPFKPGQTPLRVVPGIERVLFDYYYRGTYDEFWAQDCNDFERYYSEHADIPGTYSGGWYDGLSAATTNYYAAMSRKNTTLQRLLMGPWTHMTMREGERGCSASGDVEFGPDALYGMEHYDRERLRWYDRWLKGSDNDVDTDPPVRIFVMGGGDGHRTRDGKLFHGGHWRTEREWPLARTKRTPFYLRTAGRLTTAAPAADEAPASFSFDPDHPVPTLGGSVAGFYEMVPIGRMNPTRTPPRARMRCMVVEGPMHQKEAPELLGCRPPYLPLAARNDVLVFQTELLEEGIEITGQAEATLWITSSAVDTDFTVKLVDVYPPSDDYPEGYHMNLVDSVIRVRYRDAWDHEVLMEPEKPYRVRIVLPPTSNLFAAGHQLRIDISSSNFPRLEINPNTGEPVGRHTRTVIAHNTVFLDSLRPSHVVLPVIPLDAR